MDLWKLKRFDCRKKAENLNLKLTVNIHTTITIITGFRFKKKFLKTNHNS